MSITVKTFSVKDMEQIDYFLDNNPLLKSYIKALKRSLGAERELVIMANKKIRELIDDKLSDDID